MIEIGDKHHRAVIAPEAGGSIMSFQHKARDVLRPAPSIDAVKLDPREAACYPCVPWFGRLFGGLDYDGRRYELAATLPACDPEHALHGYGWINAWSAVEQNQNQLNCCFEYQPKDLAFPFPFRAEQSFYIDDGLEISLALKNTGATSMPAGLGLHPFFPNSAGAKIKVTEIRDYSEPANAKESHSIAYYNGSVPAEEIDETLHGWNGVAEITHAGVQIELRSNARLLHYFSPENADFFCLEPITHAPGNFGRDILAPGESLELKLRLRVKN